MRLVWTWVAERCRPQPGGWQKHHKRDFTNHSAFQHSVGNVLHRQCDVAILPSASVLEASPCAPRFFEFIQKLKEISAMLELTVIVRRVTSRAPVLVMSLAVACIIPQSATYAADLNGAWATDASSCSKVFVKKGNVVSFQQDSDQYGGGFIVEGDKLRGQMQTCNIKARKEDGNAIHMLAACASDIMTSNVQLSARIVDDNTIRRFFPGMPDELSISYSRCTM
jgi:hypothetical protein